MNSSKSKIYISTCHNVWANQAFEEHLLDTWIKENNARLGAKVAMGVGGSLDVISGRLRRAPKLWRRLRIEWLWRTLSDLRRLGRLVTLYKFMRYIKKVKKTM